MKRGWWDNAVECERGRRGKAAFRDRKCLCRGSITNHRFPSYATESPASPRPLISRQEAKR
jgi:hypothetical protein